jgi:hypothetical protein
MDRFAKFICSAENRCAKMTTLMSLKFKFPLQNLTKCVRKISKKEKNDH